MPDNTAVMQTSNSRNSDLKILVCYNKPYTMPPLDDGILLPVQGGKALSQTDLGFQADNEINGQPCDNISEKNDSYCELTVIYWAWKNLRKLYPDVKYVGLFHYRRFFSFRNVPFTVFENRPESDIESYRVDYQKVVRVLESGRVFLAHKDVFPFSVMTQYCLCHVSDDYRTIKEVIKTKFPDYYDDFTAVMERGNQCSLLNMFVMKYGDFEKYCQWLFAVMSELDPLVPYQNYNPYQKRSLAMMSERLLNVYVRKNKLKPAYSSVYIYDSGTEHKGLRSFIGRSTGVLQRNLSFIVYSANFGWLKRGVKKLLSC